MRNFIERHENLVYGGGYIIFLIIYTALVVYLGYHGYEFPEPL